MKRKIKFDKIKSTAIFKIIKYKKKALNVFICLSVILIDSVYEKDKNYYLQVFLEECKYVVKEKKKSEFITDDTEISSDDSHKENSDEENSNEEN